MTGLVGRRAFLLGAAAATVAATCVPAAADDLVCRIEPRVAEPDPQVAVSLRAITAQLKACGTSRSKCREATTLGGMTRLDGFLLDRAGNDVVLWGASETGRPGLVLDDFLVALRAAHMRYPTMENGRKVFYQPAISLDADPEHFLRLGEGYSPWDNASIAAYQRQCSFAYNHVRVDGMPRDTRVADVLLAADYKMKMVAAGSARLRIRDPFPSVQDARLQQFAWQRERGVAVKESNAVGTRFWFSAGRFGYQVSSAGDTGFLDTAQIILQDRTQLAKSGQTVDGGATDPLTRAFTCSWTERMDETLASEPLWGEMGNMFRHFAIAQILARRDALRAARFDESYLLDRHKIARVTFPDAVPGVWVVNEVDGMPHHYCGGVSVDLDDRTLLEAKEDGAVSETRQRVASSRPRRSDEIAWTVRG